MLDDIDNYNQLHNYFFDGSTINEDQQLYKDSFHSHFGQMLSSEMIDSLKMQKMLDSRIIDNIFVKLQQMIDTSNPNQKDVLILLNTDWANCIRYGDEKEPNRFYFLIFHQTSSISNVY